MNRAQYRSCRDLEGLRWSVMRNNHHVPMHSPRPVSNRCQLCLNQPIAIKPQNHTQNHRKLLALQVQASDLKMKNQPYWLIISLYTDIKYPETVSHARAE